MTPCVLTNQGKGFSTTVLLYHSSRYSVDSGVSGGHGVEQEEGTVINECLIKLQMCAATITSSLQRAEYTVTN